MLLGPPAAGKGTQAGLIRERYGIESASPGAMLREQKLAGTKLGLKADAYTRAGRLAPDALVVQVIREWLAARNGAPFLFDGFPRSLGQTAGFEELLAERGAPLDIAICLEAGPDVIRERVLRRRVCAACGNTVAGFEDSRCPRCGGALERRGDDNLESLETRMTEYREKSEPVLAHYRDKKLLATVAGDRPVEAVFKDIAALLS